MPHPNIALIYAHPSAERSLANRELLAAIDGVDVAQRALYDLYPDFDIDIEAEQRVLAAADLIVLQHPVYWYSVPALLKLWIDDVLALGWAYGDGGTALAGKAMQWVVTTGGDFRAYAPDGPHGHPFEVFIAPMRQTACFCGMHWLEPIIVHDAHADRSQVVAAGALYRERLLHFTKPHRAAPPASAHHTSDASHESHAAAALTSGAPA
jgi:glutathione-regulated potassium-efflux system ancillary protein KefF